MRIPIDKYVTLIAALHDADRKNEAADIILSGTSDPATREVVIKVTPDAYAKFGYIDDYTQLSTALRTRPQNVVLDGSVPIKISSDIKFFGKYDADVSPRLDKMIRRMTRKYPDRRWEITFTFSQLNPTLKKCVVNGTIYAVNNEEDGGKRNNDSLAAVIVGATVLDCITYAEEILPQMLG